MIILPRLYRISVLRHSTIADFVSIWRQNPSSNIWSRAIIPRDDEDILVLVRILSQIIFNHNEDALLWLPNRLGYSTKSCTKILMVQQIRASNHLHNWKRIWSLKVPLKFRIFLWNLQWGILLINGFLKKRLHHLANTCVWCKTCEEKIEHLFWNCEPVRWGRMYIAVVEYSW